MVEGCSLSERQLSFKERRYSGFVSAMSVRRIERKLYLYLADLVPTFVSVKIDRMCRKRQRGARSTRLYSEVSELQGFMFCR